MERKPYTVYAAPTGRAAFKVEHLTEAEALALLADFAKLYKPENVSVSRMESRDVTDDMFSKIAA